MSRQASLKVLFTIAAVATISTGCELELPQVDCSGINQPDMGGLICAGLTGISLMASVIAFIIALLVGLAPPL